MNRTLLDKLGWNSGMASEVWRVPGALEQEFAPLTIADSDSPVFRIGFARTQAELAEATTELAARYRPGEHLWLCYPKKSGRIPSDITRDVGWETVHQLGLLGVAQIAVDQDWSALRFRLRTEITALSRKSPTGRAVGKT